MDAGCATHGVRILVPTSESLRVCLGEARSDRRQPKEPAAIGPTEVTEFLSAATVAGKATKETIMTTRDEAANTAQDVKGKVKNAVGRATGNKRLERKGTTDQAKAAIKDAGHKAKHAVATIQDRVTGK